MIHMMNVQVHGVNKHDKELDNLLIFDVWWLVSFHVVNIFVTYLNLINITGTRTVVNI